MLAHGAIERVGRNGLRCMNATCAFALLFRKSAMAARSHARKFAMG